MTQTLADEIKEMARTYIVPDHNKHGRRMGNLNRIMKFYQTKMPEAPESQAFMFGAFISALSYAMTSLGHYQQVTKKLAELADRVENDRMEQ